MELAARDEGRESTSVDLGYGQPSICIPPTRNPIVEGDRASSPPRPSSLKAVMSVSELKAKFADNVTLSRKLLLQPRLLCDWPRDGDDDGEDHDPRHEQWYELFYDLVLVVACLQIGNLMAHNVYIRHSFKIFVLFSILRMVWVDLVSYQNRFDTPDLLHTMFYGLHGTCAFGIALHLREKVGAGGHHRRLAGDDHAAAADDHADDHAHGDEQNNFTWDIDRNLDGVVVCASVALLSTLLMSYYVSFRLTEQRYAAFVRRDARGRALAIVFLLAASWSHRTEPNNARVFQLLFVAGQWRHLFSCWTDLLGPRLHHRLAAGLAPRTLPARALQACLPKHVDKAKRPPVHSEHMLARTGAFVMICLGEGIIQLVQAPVTAGRIALSHYLRCFFGFALAWQLGGLYFSTHCNDPENHPMQDDKREGAALVWSILSTLLNFSLVYVGVGIKLAFNVEDANDLLTYREQNIFAVAATCSMTLITMIRVQHKGLRFKGKGMRHVVYFARFAVGFVPIALLLACRSFLRQTTAMTIAMYLAVMLLVLLDAFSQSKKHVADPDVENAPSPGPRPPGSPPRVQSTGSGRRNRRTSAIAAGL